MFRGSTVATIDDKGRLKVPTDFRRALEDRFGAEFFITSVAGDHALVYPIPVWEEIEAKLGMAQTGRPGELRGVWDHHGTGWFIGDWDRTCRLLAELGSAIVAPELAPIIHLHDQSTRVGSNLPLA